MCKDHLKVYETYDFIEKGNRFKLLGVHKDYLWIEWQSDDFEIESVYADEETLSKILLLE